MNRWWLLCAVPVALLALLLRDTPVPSPTTPLAADDPCPWQDASSSAGFAQAILDVTAPMDARHLSVFHRLVRCRRPPPANAPPRIVQLIEAIATAFPAWADGNDDDVDHDGTAVDVVVVGAGPVGLLSALTARERPRREVRQIVVVERRGEYTRDAWVDVSANVWYSGLRRLEKWGATLLDADAHWYTPSNPIYRTNMLERLLLRMAVLVGHIELLYNAEPIALCTTTMGADGGRGRGRAQVVIAPATATQPTVDDPCRADKDGLRLLPFDLLVGCEGSSGSFVRKWAGLGTTVHDTVDFEAASPVTPPIRVRVPDLQQPTMIVRYRADDATGECPALARQPSKDQQSDEPRAAAVVDPYDITFSHPNVTAAFRRWYRGHCQLQLIFVHEYGQTLLQQKEQAQQLAQAGESWQRAGLPWGILLSVTNKLLAHSIGSVEELRRRLSPRPLSSSTAALSSWRWWTRSTTDDVDVDIVPIRIRTTSVLAQALPSNGGSSMVAVFGDNAVTAHYRLGIGINQAMMALDELAMTIADIHQLKHTAVKTGLVFASLEPAAQRQHERARARVTAMAEYQLRTIILEAHCGFVLGADYAQASLWQSQRVFRANRTTRSFEELGRASQGRWGKDVLACLRRLQAKYPQAESQD